MGQSLPSVSDYTSPIVLKQEGFLAWTNTLPQETYFGAKANNQYPVYLFAVRTEPPFDTSGTNPSKLWEVLAFSNTTDAVSILLYDSDPEFFSNLVGSSRFTVGETIYAVRACTTLKSDTTFNIPTYDTVWDGLIDNGVLPISSGGTKYPIAYSYTNSVVYGPSEAAVGEIVNVSAVPNSNYGITDPASQILVTNNDVAVSYQWNPSTNTITFVMPDPS